MSKYYDPISAQHCQNQAFAPSYWASTKALPDLLPAITSDTNCDVVIIGGGFSGLLSAYYLATEHQQECIVLEANQVGFGASARNAGFVLKGSGRLSYPQMANKWGMDVCQGIYGEFTEAVQRVEDLIKSQQITCDPQPKGYLKIAHNQQAFAGLKAQAEFLQKHLSSDAEFLSVEELKAGYMSNQQAYGAMRLPDGFGIHPLKLVLGYKKMAMEAGVKIFEHTLASDINDAGNHVTLKANGFNIKANKLVISGNAYNSKVTSPIINNRYLPILSSIMVTKPLTQTQLESSGLKTHQVTMDTRTLKYYYRLLPDNRLLFGGRGAIFAKDQNKPTYLNNLKKGLADCFPTLNNISHDYYWHGYIAAALDDMPHVTVQGNIGYTLGYCGAGVSFSAQAAYRLAQQISGVTVPNLPLYQTPLPYLPFPSLRRFGQWGYYQYAQLKDKLG
ncbi:oxidoreductase [Pseudoalteromonas phenolica]|uniref:Oxidoreductase n=1 Tax=Pseudoalteromonas phenolica TaxID=161398 RepID=A0A4Q7IJW1_9GAMM|nr:FAD-dependent oxidoreductase [Pseudoalteromonas phenolica]RZQ51862.1 oxidoreductase [Pseudoalteromonas phenolica]